MTGGATIRIAASARQRLRLTIMTMMKRGMTTNLLAAICLILCIAVLSERCSALEFAGSEECERQAYEWYGKMLHAHEQTQMRVFHRE